jgi:hypothetical protein
MPLSMDTHTINGGVTAENVARARMTDLQTQGEFRGRLTHE